MYQVSSLHFQVQIIFLTLFTFYILYGQSFDPDKRYKLAMHNFLLMKYPKNFMVALRPYFAPKILHKVKFYSINESLFNLLQVIFIQKNMKDFDLIFDHLFVIKNAMEFDLFIGGISAFKSPKMTSLIVIDHCIWSGFALKV